MPERGKALVVRHEAHTGLSAAYSAATPLGAPVKVTGAKTVGPISAITDTPVGVSHFEISAQDVTDGRKAAFRLKGDVIPMKAAAAIAAGAKIEASATGGKVQTATTGTVLGVAWTAATGADQEILVIVL